MSQRYSFIASSGLRCEPELTESVQSLLPVVQALFDHAPILQSETLASPSPLVAEASLRPEGEDALQVVDLKFRQRGSESASPIAAFIIRFNRSAEEAERERRIAERISRWGSVFLSATAVCVPEIRGVDETAVAYLHAETQTRSSMATLKEMLPEILENPDQLRVLIAQIRGILRAVAPTGEDRLVKPVNEYMSSIRLRLLPDFIVDLRQHQAVPIEGGFAVLRADGSRLHAASLAALTEADLSTRPDWDSEWLVLALGVSVTPREERNAYYTMETDRNDVVWLFPPGGLNMSDDPSVRLRLVLNADDLKAAVRTPIELGLPAHTTAARLLEDAGIESVFLSYQHADLHTSNILCGPDASLAIDVPSFRYDIDHAAAARLEASLLGDEGLAGLPDGPVRKNLASLLAAVWTSEEQDLDTPAKRFCRQLHSVMWLRRLLADRVAGAASLSEVGNVCSRDEGMPRLLCHVAELGETCSGQLPTRVIDATEGTLGNLWVRALGDPRLGGLRARGTDILKALRAANYPFDAPVTDLQAKLLLADKRESLFSSSRHVIVAGPTSCGKSTVSDIFLVRPTLFNADRRSALYIAPTRALAQARHRELSERFPDLRLILSTGDNNKDDRQLTLGRDFDIACMTYEKSNVLLARSKSFLARLGCIVVDEIHMIGDETRGPILELLLAKAMHSNPIQGEQTRIIALTTQHTNYWDLIAWLSSRDGAGEQEPPHVVHSTSRPVVAAHWIAIPVATSEDQQDARLEMVSIPAGAACASRPLSSEELKDIDEQFCRLAPRRTSRTQVLSNCVRDLIVRKLEDHPCGHVVLVFSSSTSRMRQLASEISNRISLVKPDPGYQDRLSRAISEITTVLPGYEKNARNGVLLHYAMLDRSLRAFAELEAARCEGEARSLVILSTTTLMYGVNLAVNDVVVMGTRFAKSDRRTHMESRVLLEPTEYFNLVGRAGRLGMGEGSAEVVVVPWRDESPYQAIVVPYYCEDPVLKSQLFHAYDLKPVGESQDVQGDPRMKVLEALLEDGEERERTPLRATDFTYPFARCVLDALRHANTRDPLTMAHSSIQEVMEVLAKTLFVQQLGGDADTAGALRRAATAILEDCSAADPLALVSASQEKAPYLYKILPLGESLIDTGTEIATVAPIREMMRLLREARMALDFRDSLPVELYLLALIPQNEILRLVIQRSPEFRRGAHWPHRAAASNRADVLARAAESLSTANGRVKLEAAQAMLGEIRDRLDKSDVLRDFSGGYSGAATDVCLRVLSGVSTWMSGGTHDEALHSMNSVTSPAGVRSGRLASIERLVDQLHYKLKFLASMLAASGYGAELQRSLYVLAERVRYGCDEKGALLFAASGSPLRRSAVLSLLKQGMTPSRLLLEADSVEGEHRDLAVRLRDDVRGFAVSNLENLADVFAPEEDSDTLNERRKLSWSFWRQLRADYHSWAGGKPSANTAREAIRQCLMERGHSSASIGSSAIDNYRTNIAVTPGGDAAAFVFHGEQKGEAGWEPDVSIHFDILDTAAERIETPLLESDRQHVVVVAVPWAIDVADLKARSGLSMAPRDGRGMTTVILTPAGFAVMLCLVTRGFLSARPVFRLLTKDVGASMSVIGTADLVDLMDEEAVPDFPAALREALATFFEPRPEE